MKLKEEELNFLVKRLTISVLNNYLQKDITFEQLSYGNNPEVIRKVTNDLKSVLEDLRISNKLDTY